MGAVPGVHRAGGKMKGQDVLFSKASDEWETPQWLFDMLDREFEFDCDAAATRENSKCILHMVNALDNPNWCGYDDCLSDGINADCPVEKFFLNPPYSKIAAFVRKAYEESQKGATVVCLIPSRTDTRYWHDYVMKAQEIRFVRGRLKFNNRTLPSYREDMSHKISSATFPSCVVVFDKDATGYVGGYPKLGKTIEQIKTVKQ